MFPQQFCWRLPDIGVSGYHYWISDESGHRRVFSASRTP